MDNGNQPSVVKISGYLEKKAKLRIGTPWKKYWFVLEGRLLLYYRSKDEYEALSPCKGSINLCPPCNVKPALSATRVFQIECRASTVTLRAESRSEQERWMQALLCAIAQSKTNPNRMSHFRYSLDELPLTNADTKKIESEFARQNSMPHRTMGPKKDIIERLQNIGGQSYGGTLKTITKLIGKDVESLGNSPNISEQHKTSYEITQDITFIPSEKKVNFILCKSQSMERISNLLVENDQYSTIQEENSIDLNLDCDTTKSPDADWVIVDNVQYLPKECSANQGERKSVMLENAEYECNSEQDDSGKEIGNVNPNVLVENDEYCPTVNEVEQEKIDFMLKREHLYERISIDSKPPEYTIKQTNNSEETLNNNTLYERISNSFNTSPIETDQPYSIVLREREPVKQPIENEYSLPIIDTIKNTVLIDNDQYIPAIDDKTTENHYANGLLLYTPDYTEYAAVDKSEQESLYEDPDRLKNDQEYQPVLYQEIEPSLEPRCGLKQRNLSEDTSSQASSNDARSNKKSRKSIFNFFNLGRKIEASGAEVKAKPKRRSKSFLRKVWRRKAKSLDSEDDDAYEIVDVDLLERKMGQDKTDIQMLQELQRILEERKSVLKKKLNSVENEGSGAKQSDDSTMASTSEEKGDVVVDGHTDECKQRPSLPPRQNSTQSLSNKIVKDSLIISHDNPEDNIKSIDEILIDLDNEKDMQQSRQRVKELIEKFNDIQSEDDVVIRKKTKMELLKSPSDMDALPMFYGDFNDGTTRRESDELTKLLDELSKVTSAPVLTPGVTTSLVTHTLTDEEWLQLIPIRRRRLSDPDYDVPRPHRSLQLQGRTKKEEDNPIPFTRFFGPILPPSSTNDNVTNSDVPYISMDPDSLEIEALPSPLLPNIILQDIEPKPEMVIKEAKERTNGMSYTSHNYINVEISFDADRKQFISNESSTSDWLHSNNDDDDIGGCLTNKAQEHENIGFVKIDENCKPDLTKPAEKFVDSLEPPLETSTAF